MDRFLEVFNSLVENNRAALEKNQVSSFVGWWYNSWVLKLQKKGWSFPALHENPIHSGIFFSIWLTEKDLEKSMFNYNIHALKLRELEGYTIKSREFADDFRSAFATDQPSWKNVSVNYGPLTLMQGYIPLVQDSFEKDVDHLVKKFIPLCPIIDKLLEARKK
ncbi:hypothetical protein SAMN05421821_12816 [Mucilaginibacter lappiensis]|uniref:Uncharacterized protein n=1 Tax=Mucilaginibacter lappiensis TaxID=354630 RepID=A0ABR6PEA2_9SPHI|nr:hypothetical protein [Mucilaginibacter lappiensis]MBB6108100.1 hypothetical protein [Mucilaginibacter lappiensis]SIS11638.1 hypothetical protein SAMN05421821_12816 [Mucilaginibacter lappiensis]